MSGGDPNAVQNGIYDKDYEHLDSNMHEGTALRKIQTAGSISISPELFEKIYLSPQNQVKGDIRKTFGNPTPVALGGFLLSLSPLTNALMAWRGAGELGAAETGVYFFFGGLCMVIGGVLVSLYAHSLPMVILCWLTSEKEFVLGNTFPSVVFTLFGAFWLSFASTLQPFYGAAKAYDPTATEGKALMDPDFANTFALFLVYMGVLCFVFLICAIRTNLVFLLIFALLVPAFGCLSAAFYHVGAGEATSATNLQFAGAALAYAVCILGWYLFAVQMFAAVDLPINLPVFDLSTLVPGGSDLQKKKQDNAAQDVEGQRGSKLKFWKKS